MLAKGFIAAAGQGVRGLAGERRGGSGTRRVAVQRQRDTTAALEETSDPSSLAAGEDSSHSPALPCLFGPDVRKQKVPNPGLLDLTTSSLPFLFFLERSHESLGSLFISIPALDFFFFSFTCLDKHFYSLLFPFAWVQAHEQ